MTSTDKMMAYIHETAAIIIANDAARAAACDDAQQLGESMAKTSKPAGGKNAGNTETSNAMGLNPSRKPAAAPPTAKSTRKPK